MVGSIPVYGKYKKLCLLKTIFYKTEDGLTEWKTLEVSATTSNLQFWFRYKCLFTSVLPLKLL